MGEALCMSSTLKHTNAPENADLLKKAKSDNKHTFSTFNCTWVTSPKCDRKALFGVTKRPLMAERFSVDGRAHYFSYLQKQEKYAQVPQEGYVMPATRGMEQTLVCCDCVFRSAVGLKRHVIKCHHDRKPASKRKRPSKVVFKRRVVRRVVQANPDLGEESDGEGDEAE